MSGGFYCDRCGTLYARLPSGLVFCARCGGLGLRGYDRKPRRLTCEQHPAWTGWDDGGVNNDLARHQRQAHTTAPEEAPE